MDARTRFVAYEAKEARAESPVPLLIGLTGPSGGGKTYSALRLATGIQSVVGGEIFVVDTEQRRALHYAEKFNFKHVNFEAPFGATDYLEALRFCKSQGAGVVVIDSCSHEHDGPGGLLEQHETELDRMAGSDWKKRERVQMLAWQKPKAGRRKLIAAITTELNMPVIFCFRAKKTTKPVKNPETGKQEPVDMGFSSIGADEWLFEMALNAVLLPGSRGVPIWKSDLPGEQLAIKLPEQFFPVADRGGPLNEAVGRFLANWAAGKKTESPKTEQRQFEAKDGAPPPTFEDDLDENPNANHGEQFNDTPEENARAEQVIDEVEQTEANVLRDKVRDAEDIAGLNEVEALFEQAMPRLKGDDITELRGRIARKREGLK